MSSSREGLNPLRPYYIPPSIGVLQGTAPPATSTSQTFGSKNGAATYASSARDMFSEIDYSDYVSDGSQSTLGIIRELLDQALYKYMSVLLAHPFDVAKTVLQVRSQADGDGCVPLSDAEEFRGQASTPRVSQFNDYPSDDSDPDEPAYFTSSAPFSSSYSASRSRRRGPDSTGYVNSPPSSRSSEPHQVQLRRTDSILEVISQLWATEGAWGVWKASNATFVYGVLLKTVESWSRSLIAAVVNVPDPGMIGGLGIIVDVADSPYPWASLGVAVGASAMAGLLLAPLDLVRTKLILTSTSTPKRGFLHNARLLPTYTCPPTLIIPTILYSIVSPLMTHATALLLRSRLAIDPILTPMTFSVATFCTSTIELFLKLPLETVLRRGQMSVVSSSSYRGSRKELEPIVDIGPYRGTVGTMWWIVRQEGFSMSRDKLTGKTATRGVKKSSSLGARKGQGIEGLWRGWRVGMWGLIGIWGAAALGGAASSGGEF